METRYVLSFFFVIAGPVFIIQYYYNDRPNNNNDAKYNVLNNKTSLFFRQHHHQDRCERNFAFLEKTNQRLDTKLTQCLADSVIVSAIMPTFDSREPFLDWSITQFKEERKLFPRAELIVIDDSPTPKSLHHFKTNDDENSNDDKYIRYIHLDERTSIGEKRNIGIRASNGDIIILMDDDDFSFPDRLREQTRLIRKGLVDMIVPRTELFFSVVDGLLYRAKTNVRSPLLMGTSAFRKSLFGNNKCTYPHQNLDEDHAFLACSYYSGASLYIMKSREIIVRHFKNTWKFDLNKIADPIAIGGDGLGLKGLGLKLKHMYKRAHEVEKLFVKYHSHDIVASKQRYFDVMQHGLSANFLFN